MHFVRGEPGPVSSVGILAGAFNPPTIAHVALMEAARDRVERIICVLPREFPHKHYHGATLEQRIEMLDRIAASGEPFDVAVSSGGLFIDIARECRAAIHPNIDIAFLCGSDAAERITRWDYGQPGAIVQMLEEFRLLVAGRGGWFEPPPELSHRVERVKVPAPLDAISSTEVRLRVEKGEPWERLTPPAIHDLIRAIYLAR